MNTPNATARRPRQGRDARGLARTGALAALLALAGLAPGRSAAAEDGAGWVELTCPAAVTGLRVIDGDGDGIADVFVVAGREVRGWRGVKDGVPGAEPTWTWSVPDTATFVAPAGPLPLDVAVPRTPTLLALAGAQALRLVPGKPPIVEEGLAVDVPWNDAGKAVLADFVAGNSLVLPTPTGFRWTPNARVARRTAFDLAVPPTRKLTPPGPFVEDVALLETTWSLPVVVPFGKAAKSDAVVALGEDGLHAFSLGMDGVLQHQRAPIDALPREGTVRDVIVDLDGDSVPDLVRECTTNDSGLYAFLTWSSSPVAQVSSPVPIPAPTLVARSSIRLKGFQIPTDYVDLDGDGRVDFVVTTIDIDNKNVLRAVAQGRVTARTRAFLNRGGAGGSELFSSSPDAEIESDIRVRILFTFSGSIDVQRSYTILATADLDGDGRKDLAIRTPEGALKVHRGTASGVWEKEARTVAIPPVGKSPDVEGYVGEATGDKRDDLVLLYRAPAGGGDRLFLLPGK